MAMPAPGYAAARPVARSSARQLIVTFRYQTIQQQARRDLDGAQAADANPADPNLAAVPSGLVGRYLRLSARAFAAEKQAVLARQHGATLVEDYSLLPVAVVSVPDASAAAALAEDPGVLSVAASQSYSAEGGAASPSAASPADLSLIDDVKAQAAGDLGEGTVAAVLDDGTDYTTNNAFGVCPKAGAVTCSVLAYDDTAAPPAKGLSFSGHGTNVAGQVLKVAPAAKLVIGNVFHSSKGQVSASDPDILKGLNWVLRQAEADATLYSFRSVNLSLGDPFSYHTTTCGKASPYTGVFSQLRTAGIQPVVAAGNTAYNGTKFTDGVATPACTPGALVVGAVYDKDMGKRVWNQNYGGRKSDCTDKNARSGQITCFTQGGPLLAVLAPGVQENAAGVTESGTSQATPLVTGAIAAIASGALSRTTGSIVSSILATGKKTLDPRSKRSAVLLDVYAADKQAASAGTVIHSGNVGLGIQPWGDLNVPGQKPSAGGTTTYGLRYLPANNDFTGPGCPCEGWGVADPVSGADGYADEATGDAGQTLVRFVHTATTATSTVTIGREFQVTNAYSPVKGVPDLYQDQVVIKNIGSAKSSDVRYRRLVDWDIEPTAFDEYVTVQGYGNAPVLTRTSNDGFNSADPLSLSSDLGATGNFTRYGPLDQGAQFNFDFGALAAGAHIAFTEYYGAAGSEAKAYADLAKVKAEAYSVGEPSSSSDGTPNSAILGFSGIGGKPLKFPPAA